MPGVRLGMTVKNYTAMRATTALVLACGVLHPIPLRARQTAEVPATPAKHFEVIDEAGFDPARLLPPPPAPKSLTERVELARIRQLIASADQKRIDQAEWDDAHEDPSIFDEVLGRKLEALPATWSLIRTVEHDAKLASDRAKAYFERPRPWASAPDLRRCKEDAGDKPLTSYPSGHSILGYSVGWTLAQLQPAKAAAILERARDYALSRELCGAHFQSDTEASHVLGTWIAMQILGNPRVQERVAAARAELASGSNQ